MKDALLEWTNRAFATHIKTPRFISPHLSYQVIKENENWFLVTRDKYSSYKWSLHVEESEFEAFHAEDAALKMLKDFLGFYSKDLYLQEKDNQEYLYTSCPLSLCEGTMLKCRKLKTSSEEVISFIEGFWKGDNKHKEELIQVLDSIKSSRKELLALPFAEKLIELNERSFCLSCSNEEINQQKETLKEDLVLYDTFFQDWYLSTWVGDKEIILPLELHTFFVSQKEIEETLKTIKSDE